MKKFLGKRFLGLPLIVSILLAVALVGGVAFAATYFLNKTIPATVTINAIPTPTPTPPPTPTPTPTPPPPVEATLYTDALATVPIPGGYTHNFGTVDEGGTPQNPLWFRAAEITPGTINVTATGLPAGATIGFIVGTPMNSQPGKPCPLALWLSNVPVGTYNFSFTVTGTGS